MPPRHTLPSQWLEMPYRPFGKTGPLNFRGPLHLRGWVGLRPEANKTSLSFFSILNDSSKLMTVSRLWMSLLGLETGKHLSCQHWSHQTLLVVSFVSVSTMILDFISLFHLVTLSFWQGHQTVSLLWLSFRSDFRKPKGPLHLWAHVSQLKIFVAPQTDP